MPARLGRTCAIGFSLIALLLTSALLLGRT
jgi:hypothetical protein